ncbi:hypothetical protein BDQ12DRAFT_713239 [Crucibulum laeve]|uniref:DUF6533 domain-containing protein n=1 Tax=Crucibulum laeve TaxID=68775 RepID=A0A5C3LX63_9AGAR|nr:hypothetical protein BDQ12DRAFT_713239 [Crucibulum laeve]
MPLPINSTEDDIIYALGLQTSNYFYVSALAFLLYDMILYFSQEVKYIWSTEWSIPKLLYYFARYYPLIRTGIHFSFANMTNLPVSVYEATDLYYIRADGWLIFFQVPKILVVSWIPELVTTIHIGIIVSRNTYQSALPGCQTKEDAELARSLYAFQLLGWIPPLCVGLILFILTLVKFRNTVPAPTKLLGITGVKALMSPDVSSPLLASLFRDGTIYFFVIFVVLADSIPQLGGLSSYLSPYFIAIYSISEDRNGNYNATGWVDFYCLQHIRRSE